LTENFLKKIEDSQGTYYGSISPQGQRHGLGVNVSKSDQSIYEGQWHEGQMNGYGRMFLLDGDMYEGHWQNGLHHGEGSYIHFKDNATPQNP